jgi:hypothetical protein
MLYVSNPQRYSPSASGCLGCRMTEIMGTACLVHGTWYLRYLHGGGTMVPIEASVTVKDKLEDGAMVRMTGYINTDGRGCPRSVHPTEIERLGDSG